MTEERQALVIERVDQIVNRVLGPLHRTDVLSGFIVVVAAISVLAVQVGGAAFGDATLGGVMVCGLVLAYRSEVVPPFFIGAVFAMLAFGFWQTYPVPVSIGILAVVGVYAAIRFVRWAWKA